jgi:hypothetical protein
VAVKDNGETVVPVEISIDDQNDFLLPNFNVDVKIYIDQPDSGTSDIPVGNSQDLMVEK